MIRVIYTGLPDIILDRIMKIVDSSYQMIVKKIRQIILISSINVYGENLKRPSKETDQLKPKTTYGLIKMVTERIYRYFSETNRINVTILRLAGIYGPEKKTGFLTQIIKSIRDKLTVPVSYNERRQQRDLLYINDAINGII